MPALRFKNAQSVLRTVAIISATTAIICAATLQTYLTVHQANVNLCDSKRRDFYVAGNIKWARALGGAVEAIHARRISRQQYYHRVSDAYSVYLPLLDRFQKTKCQ